jgi:photosystem II stability/assembly factor-like uncharacterized protein
VFHSPDGGATWTPSAGIPAGARLASDRVNPNLIYGFADGVFYVSEDAGTSFAPTAAPELPGTGNVRFEAVPGHEGHVWLAGGAVWGESYGLWSSTDAGATFQRLQNVDEADTIGFGKPAADGAYPTLYSSARIGGVRGIYRSTDAGHSWVRVNDDKHQYAWTGAAITGDPRVYGRVYVATNGRGIVYGEPCRHKGPRRHGSRQAPRRHEPAGPARQHRGD